MCTCPTCGGQLELEWDTWTKWRRKVSPKTGKPLGMSRCYDTNEGFDSAALVCPPCRVAYLALGNNEDGRRPGNVHDRWG